jgi:hypothetical protein
MAQSWVKKIDETEGGLEKFSRVSLPGCSHSPISEAGHRALRGLALMYTTTGILLIVNGHRMRLKRALSVTLVLLPPWRAFPSSC